MSPIIVEFDVQRAEIGLKPVARPFWCGDLTTTAHVQELNVSELRQSVFDLTKRLNPSTEIYQDGPYSDPDFKIETWCSVASQGFWVSSVNMGTQTGTHIDAPAHFLDGGQTLEALDVRHLVGPYFRILSESLADPRSRHQALQRYAGEDILFLISEAPEVALPESAIADLIALGCKVWVVAPAIEIVDQAPLQFHRLLAENGVFLVEDIDLSAARRAPETGQMIALPLRLEGVSGSPCRVIILDSTEL